MVFFDFCQSYKPYQNAILYINIESLNLAVIIIFENRLWNEGFVEGSVEDTQSPGVCDKLGPVFMSSDNGSSDHYTQPRLPVSGKEIREYVLEAVVMARSPEFEVVNLW